MRCRVKTMVKQLPQRAGMSHGKPLLPIVAVALVWGATVGWAEQQGAKPASSGARSGTATVKIIGKSKPPYSAMTRRKARTATNKTSLTLLGKRDPFKLPPEPVPGRGGPGNMLDA